MTDPRDLNIILCDTDRTIVRAWERHFHGFGHVEIVEGDLTEVFADAYVSPANSYGWMDGGIDLALRERFVAGDIERQVQESIAAQGGFLPVGAAIIVEMDDDEVPYLISAPMKYRRTFRTPVMHIAQWLPCLSPFEIATARLPAR